MGGVDNDLNLSSRSHLSGQMHFKTFEIRSDGEAFNSKGLLYKMLNSAMHSYNQTLFDDRCLTQVHLSNDSLS